MVFVFSNRSFQCTSSFDPHILKKRAEKCHTRMKAFEKRKRESNLQYLRDVSKTIEHDLKELDVIAKSLVEESDTDQQPFQYTGTVTVEVSDNEDDDFFEAVQ